jgi:hypothetical protein
MRIGRPADWPRVVKRDVEQAGGLFRVVVEQLVEIPHAIEQQQVRILRLQAQVLLHHGGVLPIFCGRLHAGRHPLMPRKVVSLRTLTFVNDE